MKNYILLDMDGVINVINHMPPGRKSGWMDEWKRREINGYSILWSTELVKELNDMHNSGDFEIVVLSTWTDLAVSLLFPEFGITSEIDFTVLGLERESRGYKEFSIASDGWWKLLEAEAFIQKIPGNRFFWIDDDIKYYKDSVEIFVDRNPESAIHLNCPSESVGITRDDVEFMRSFVV